MLKKIQNFIRKYEYYIYHCCCNRFVSLDTDGIVLPHNVFITTCYPILNNFYILLVNLIFIGLLCKIKGLCA